MVIELICTHNCITDTELSALMHRLKSASVSHDHLTNYMSKDNKGNHSKRDFLSCLSFKIKVYTSFMADLYSIPPHWCRIQVPKGHSCLSPALLTCPSCICIIILYVPKKVIFLSEIYQLGRRDCG